MKRLPKALCHKTLLAAAIPLIMAVQAQGFEFYAGGIEGSFDSQFSMGSSWRVEDQDDRFLSPGNSEDGNANYKSGDAFSQILKGSHDLQFSYENFGGFVRGKYWYDAALENNSVDYGHTPNGSINGSSPGEKLDDSGFNDLAKFSGAALLDAFVYGEFELGDMPLDVRLGKQVVSWGESTFIFGGINAINPVDVSAFQRPGAEIKEGLIPVNMAYANIGLSDNLSAEAFYQLEFQETVIPGCGTYFSTNDYAPQGCNVAITVAGDLDRGDDVKGSSDGQFGIALRYVSEALGDTEFGFYAMNIHSRNPLISGVKHNLTALQQGAAYVQGANLAYAQAGLSTTQGETPAALQVGIDAGDANSIALQAAAVNAGNGYVAIARTADSQYFISYPEDMQLLGVSFATNVGSMALSGEITHKKDVPLQINATQLIGVSLSGNSTSQALTDDVAAVTGGGVIQGYRSFDVSQAQVTAIKIFDRVAGASRVTLIGEAGYTFIHSFDESADAIKFSRSGTFDPAAGEAFDNDGFVTESSWGYRTRIVADYSDVFSGVNLTPILAWNHDVKGFAPQPGGAFREGQKSLGFTLKADYLTTYNAAISYTQFMGGDYSVVSDRDFASISVGMQF